MGRTRVILLVIFMLTAVGISLECFQVTDFSSRDLETYNISENDIVFQTNSPAVLDLLPTPKIKVQGYKLLYEGKQILDGNGLVIELPLLTGISMVFGDVNIKDVILNSDVKIIAEEGWLDYKLGRELLSDSRISNLNISLGKLNVVNLGMEDVDIAILTNVNFKPSKGSIHASGTLERASINPINFKASIVPSANGSDIDLSIDGKSLAGALHLKNFNHHNFTLDSGSIGLNLISLDEILGVLKYYTSVDAKSLNKDGSFSIKSDIISDSQGQISLENTSIEGNLLQNADLSFKLYKVSDDIFESQVSLVADKLSLDFLDKNFDLNTAISDLLKALQLPSNLNSILNIKIGEITSDSESAKEFDLYIYTVMGRHLVERINVNLPGNSTVQLKGIISNNNTRSKFEGFIDIDSKDYDALFATGKNTKKPLRTAASLFVMPNIVKASNLHYETNDSKGNGYISRHSIPYSEPATRIFMDIEGFDMDETGVVQDFYEYINSLYDADSDKTGEQYFIVTRNNNWLRNIKENLFFGIEAQNIKLRGVKLDNINTTINIRPRHIDIKKLEILDKDIVGSLKIKYVLPVMRPQISANGSFRKLDMRVLEKFYPEIERKTNNLNFFSANSYDGEFNLKVDDLIITDYIQLSNLDAKGSLKSGYLLVERLNGGIWNGSFQSSLGIIVSQHIPTFKLNFNAYSINPQYLFNHYTGLNKVSGLMSLAGSVGGNLTKLEDFNSANGKIDFAGANIEWDGLSINKIVEIVDGNYVKASKIEGLQYYTKYGGSKFDTVTGSMDLNQGLISIQNADLKTNRASGLYSVNYNMHSKSVNGAGTFAFIPIGADKPINIRTKTTGRISNPATNEVDYSEVLDFVNKS